jgi:hypothetical protein
MSNNMNPIFKKLWYPTAEDVFGSRILFLVLFPILILLDFLLKTSNVFIWGFLIILTICCVMIIRRSMILPVSDNFAKKFQSQSLKSLKVIRALAFTLPVLPFFSLLIIPEHFYICFVLSAI